MRREFIRHDNMRKYFEMLTFDDKNDIEIIKQIVEEFKHSNLILAAEIVSDSIKFIGGDIEGENFGVLFTDMDEFRKSFPNHESDSLFFDFAVYCDIVRKGVVDGFIINPESEGFVLTKDLFLDASEFPDHEFKSDDSLSAAELKSLYESINNSDLEEFITNSANIGKYEELFEMISKSTLLTLMLSKDDLSKYAEDGVITQSKTEPFGFLYIDELGGNYATVYSSESKMRDVETSFYKYSQIVNFSQMTNFILNDDMDGIIINLNTDNVLLTREVLLKYWALIEKTCNDSKLNSAIFHMFLMDEV